MKSRLNFSPQPFQEARGHIIVLWLVNLVLVVAFAATVWFWLQLKDRNAADHRKIDGLKERQQEISLNHVSQVREMEELDIKNYRKQVLQYHGIQTAFSTHWGGMLDDLGTLLSEDVRLVSLSPSSSSARRLQENTLLKLRGEARTKKAQLDFIRILQKKPAFQEVRFATEEYLEGDVALVFEITFTYKPAGG